MRDIKFRAYDKFAETMMYDEDIGILPSNDITGTTSYGNVTLINVSNEHYEIMQYIGLKDKNGVEIYEDDTIQTVLDDGARFSKFIVKWNVNTASFRMIRYQDDFGFKIDTIVLQNKEVIGNIHEQESHT